MSIFSINEYKNLVYKIEYDPRYHRITDPHQRMLYLITERYRLIKELGERVLDICRDYERKHLKCSQMASSFFVQVEKHRKENNFEKTIEAWNAALRSTPQDWSDWSIMYELLFTYVKRAQYFYENSFNPKAYSDLKHATSILNNFEDQTRMILHLKDNNEIIALMLSLKLHLTRHSKVLKTKSWLQEWLLPFNLYEEIQNIQTPNVEKLKDDLCKLNLPTLFAISQKFDENFLLLEHEFSENIQENFWINPKLKLNYNKTEGRNYIATEHLVEKEIILKEKPLMHVIFKSCLLNYCTYCCSLINTLWPCEKCDEVVFCSYNCSQKAKKSFHEKECGIYGLILGKDNFYSLSHVFRFHSIFGAEIAFFNNTNYDQDPNYDLKRYMENEVIRTKQLLEMSDRDKYEVCRAISSLLHHRGKRDSIRESSHTALSFMLFYFFIYKNIVDKSIIKDFKKLSLWAEHLTIAMLKTCTNGFCWAEENEEESKENENEIIKIASCICFVSSFFNHSCDPNVSWFIRENGITLSAIRAIAPGEPLTICYGPKKWNKFILRQQRLKDDYCFFCRCRVCRTDAARCRTAMKCFITQNCPGPLLLNKYESCLTCGKKPTNLAQAHQVERKMEKNAEKFIKLLRSITDKESHSKLFFCFKFLTKQIEKKSPIQSVLQKQKTIPDGKLAKLEKYFKNYLETVYNSSFHLFNRCVLLLYVYNHGGIDSRGLGLIETIINCLNDMYPELIDSELATLVYKLDYACKFFDNIIKMNLDLNKFQYLLSSSKNIISFKNDSVSKSNSINNFSQFWCLIQKLNQKLFDILSYDMQHRGDFFPKLYNDLIENNENDHLDKIPETILPGEKNSGDAFEPRYLIQFTSKKVNSPSSNQSESETEEIYFKKMYETCRRRMTELEHILV